jgi:hypothetical protein
MSAFYPGAGTDLAPPILFPAIKIWHYMDSQPRPEYGAYPILSRPTFIKRLDQTMTQCDFELSETNDDLRVYYSPSTKQTIYYETNANFPDSWNPTTHKADTLVLCGFDIDNDGRQNIPPEFFPSYSDIITNNITCETVWKNNILPFQNLSQLNYPKDGSFEYWVADQDTGSNFRKHVSVERGIKWPDLPGK